MAFNSIIGALRVVLGADTAQFDTAMKDGVKKVQSFGVDIAKAGAAAGAALAAIGATVGAAVGKALGEVGKVGKIAQQVGVPVEQLSALKYAAEASGLSIDQLGEGMKQLGLRMAEAAGDAHSGPARAFAAIGVSVKDANGQLRSTSDVMLDVADKFKKFRDGPGKTALGEQLGLAELIPLLNKGRDGIGELTDEAAKLGIIIDGQTSAAARTFNKNLEQVNKTKEALVTILAARLAPAMERLSERFLAFVQDAARSKDATDFLTGSFKTLVSVVEVAIAGVRIATTALSTFWQIFKNNSSREEEVALWKKAWADITGAAGSASKEIAAVWADVAKPAKKAADDSSKPFAPAIEAARALAERLQAARAELQSFISLPTQNFAEKMVAIQQALNQHLITNAQAIKMTDDVYKQLRENMKETLQTMLDAPMQDLTSKINAVNDAWREGIITQREYAKLTKQIVAEQINQVGELASQTVATFKSVFGEDTALAIASVIVDTGRAIMRAWAEGGIFAGPMVALIAAQGLAQLAKIKSTNIGSSGGGAPAAPSMPAAAGKEAPGGGGGGMPSGVLTVQFSDPLAGADMRKFAERLLEYQKNGGQVVFA